MAIRVPTNIRRESEDAGRFSACPDRSFVPIPARLIADGGRTWGMMRLIVAALATLGMTTPAWAQTPPEVVTVTVKAADGTNLVGTYFNPGRPGPALLLLHQCNQDRTGWLAFGATAAARGYHVLTYDYRGYGESGGPRHDTLSDEERRRMGTETWPGDVDAAFEFLLSRPGVDRARVGAAGASCGGGQAVFFARRHPQVRTIVLLSGGTAREPREFVASTPTLPVLGVASLDDGPVVAQMRAVTGMSEHPGTRFVEYRTAGHGTDMFRVEPGLEPLMLDWFDTHVATAPAAVPVRTAGTGRRDAFDAALANADYDGARRVLEEARAANPHAVLFIEDDMNQLGYQRLDAGDRTGAIAVFELNIAAYPASANAHDSLSDAQLAAGNSAEALRLAEKALALLDADTNAPDAYKQAIRESAERKIKELRK